MAANLFEKAKAAQPTKPKAKGKAKPEINVEDLRMYAALNAAQKTIATLVDSLKESVNDQALEAFLASQKKDSINGVDGDTNASLQLRKRTSRSVLSDHEQTVLAELGIDISKSADSRFYISNKYAEDTELLGKVSDALDGIVPDDFLGHTGDKYVVGDKAVIQALEIDDANTRRDVLKMVATQAARTKFGGSHDEMLEILDEVLKG